MEQTKEQLTATIEGLEGTISKLQSELSSTKCSLNDINKPKITEEVWDIIEDAISEKFGEYLDDLSASDFDFEFYLDGNELMVDSMEGNYDNNSEDIVNSVREKFNVVEELPLNSGDVAVEQEAEVESEDDA